MSFCSGIDEECRVYINHPCESPTLQMLGKSYVDEEGNAVTTNSANGVSTTITTTPEGRTTVVQTVGTESTTTTLKTVKKSAMSFAGEGKEFDTDDYYHAQEMDEHFVDIKEMMKLIGAEVGIIAFTAMVTELVLAWYEDRGAVPQGLYIRAQLGTGYLGHTDRDRADYLPNLSKRIVKVSQENSMILEVPKITLTFKLIRGDRGKKGVCRR